MIGEAIDAILGQTYQNFELIIVNDGSKDNTEEILKKYQQRDKRVHYITKNNEGIPDTVNRGWREAKGKYITWTSDDNLYYPNTLERLVNYLELNPETWLVYTDCRYIDGEGAPMYNVSCKGPEALANECPIMGCLLFRREVFDHVDMFQRRWRRVHDYDFYRRIWCKFRVDHLPECLYDYRLHAESMTGNHFAMTTEHAELLASTASGSRERRQIWANCWHEIAKQAIRDGRQWRAVTFESRAAVQEPSRLPAAFSLLWRTLYQYTPTSLKNAWRATKRTLKVRS